ncbi:MAG TPA: ribosome maturation factor RimM [Euzebyales bacterium]|nr:ribosome maturation factor RimM [Euzebyales bacterium]
MAPRAVLGTVGKPFGLAGDVYVWVDPDLGDTLVAGVSCQAGARTLEVAHVRRHRGRPLVRFVGVDDREAALELRGLTLEIDRAAIAADADTVWADDVLGRDVVDAAGDLVGVVDGILDGAAHDFLVVARPDGGELLIPVVAELVDLAEPVVVHGPPGLTDPDQAIE